MKIDRTGLHELLVYGAIWLLVFLFPILNESVEVSRGSEFMWTDIFRWWIGALPFYILFFIHNYILVPQFVQKSRFRWYAILTVTSIIIFGIWQSLSFDRRMDCCAKKIECRAPATGPLAPPASLNERHGPSSFTSDPISFQTPHSDCRHPAGPQPPVWRQRYPQSWWRPAPGIFPMPVLLNTVLGILMLGFNLAIVFLFRYWREQEKLETLEKMQMKDELKYLKTQISPHFFMNMLNNIHAMVETDPARAQDMILGLSKLMRYVLYEGANSLTTFANEVCFISSYMALMRQRYPSDKVDIRLNLPENPSDNVKLPPLLFIAFVENAFKHGISYRQKSYVYVTMEERDRTIWFECVNSKVPRENRAVGGVGLDNVRRRLDLLYNDRYALDIEDTGEKWRVLLTIPFL